MAEKLGAILVRKGLITQAQLDEALNSQLIYGGRLGTHLVEMGLLDIDTLGMALGEQLRLPVAMEADFDVVPEATLKLLTAAQAEKHLAFPLGQEGRRLKVALASPLEIQHVDALGFITGLRIIPHVTPELRLFEYQLRRYGIQRPVRSSRPKTVSAAARRPAAPLPATPSRPAAMAPGVAPPASMPPAPVRAEPGAAAMFGGLAPGQFLSDDAEPVEEAAVQWAPEAGDTDPLRASGGPLSSSEAMIDFTEDGEAQVAPPVLSSGATGGPPVLSPVAGSRPGSPPRLAPSEPPRAPMAPPPARPTSPMHPPGMQARTGAPDAAAPIVTGVMPSSGAQPPGMQARAAGAPSPAAPHAAGAIPSGSAQLSGAQSRAMGGQDASAPLVTGTMSSASSLPPGMQSRVAGGYESAAPSPAGAASSAGAPSSSVQARSAGVQDPAAPVVMGAMPSGAGQPPGMQSRAGGPPAGGASRASSPGMPAVAGANPGGPPRRPSSPGLSPVGGEERASGIAQPPGMTARPGSAPPGAASTPVAQVGAIPPGMRATAPSGPPQPPGMAPKPIGPPPTASRPPGPVQGPASRPLGPPTGPGMPPGSAQPPGMAPRPSGPPAEAGRVAGAPGMGARPAGPPMPLEGVPSAMAPRPGGPPVSRPDSSPLNAGLGASPRPAGASIPSPDAHASGPGSAPRSGGHPMASADAPASAAAPGLSSRPAVSAPPLTDAASGNAPRPASPPMPLAEATPATPPRPGVTAPPPGAGAQVPSGVPRAVAGTPPGMAPRPMGPPEAGSALPMQGTPVGAKPSTTLVPGQLTPQGMPAPQGAGVFAGDAGVRPPTGSLPPGALRPVAQPVSGQVPQQPPRPIPSAHDPSSTAALPPLESGPGPHGTSTQPPSAFPPGALTTETDTGGAPLALPTHAAHEAVIPTPPLFVAGAELLSADVIESEPVDLLALEPIEDIEALDSDVLDIDLDSAPEVLADPQDSAHEPVAVAGKARAIELALPLVDGHDAQSLEGASASEERSTWASAFDVLPESPSPELPVELSATLAPPVLALPADEPADLVGSEPIEFIDTLASDSVDADSVPEAFTELSWGDATDSELKGIDGAQSDVSNLELPADVTGAEAVRVDEPRSFADETGELAQPSTLPVSELSASTAQTPRAQEVAAQALDASVPSQEKPQPISERDIANEANAATPGESLLADSAGAFEWVAESGITPEPFGSTEDAKASSLAFTAESALRSDSAAPLSEEQWASVPLPAIAVEPDSKRSNAVDAASADVSHLVDVIEPPTPAELSELVGEGAPAGAQSQGEGVEHVDAIARSAGNSHGDVPGRTESTSPEPAGVAAISAVPGVETTLGATTAEAVAVSIAPQAAPPATRAVAESTAERDNGAGKTQVEAVAHTSVGESTGGKHRDASTDAPGLMPTGEEESATAASPIGGGAPELEPPAQQGSTPSPGVVGAGDAKATGHAGDTAASIELFEVERVSGEQTGVATAPLGQHDEDPVAPGPDGNAASPSGLIEVVGQGDDNASPSESTPSVSAQDVQGLDHVAPVRPEEPSSAGTSAQGAELSPATAATESEPPHDAHAMKSAPGAPSTPHAHPKSAQETGTASPTEPQSHPAREHISTLPDESFASAPIVAIQDEAAEGPSAHAWGLESAPAEPAPVPERRVRVPIELDDLGPASDEPMQLASTWEFVGWQGQGAAAQEPSEPSWNGRAVELDAPASVAHESDDVALASAWDFMQPWQPPADGNDAAMALLAAASASLETPTEGPAVSADQLLSVLDRVGTQALVGKLLLAYSAGRFRRAFLLGESFGLARVGRAWGAGSESPQVAALSVDLESPSLFASALSSGAPRVFSTPDCPQDETIFTALCEPASHLLVAPLRVRGRPVAFFVAEHGPAPVAPEMLAEVTRVAEKVTATYGRLQQHERAG
ncbi:hypothetical protein DRW03_19110 [Corallococcus sp. H22C18031201]|nr:hypothetical protein DRW03_19110 [Corallococcus sp. H22C18031201]